MRRDLILLLALTGLGGGCQNSPNSGRDGEADDDGEPDAQAEVDAGEAGEDVTAPDGPDVSDGDADAEADAETWDFGADLWDPAASCDSIPDDPPGWMAPSCGDGCSQILTASEVDRTWTVSDRWLVYESGWHSRVVDLPTGEDRLLFCHPAGYHAVYGLAVDADVAVYALGTHFLVGEQDVNYTGLWAVDLPRSRSWPVAEWVKPRDRGYIDLAYLASSDRQASFVMYDVERNGSGSWITHGDIYVADIDARTVTRISDFGWPGLLGDTDIAGNWVVYTTVVSLFAYNLDLGTTIGPDLPGDQIWSRTDGVNVTWLDHRNYPGGYMSGGSWDIYSYNFASEAETRVTTPATPVAEDAAPDMLGDVIVWSDGRNATTAEPHHRDVFLYRYSTGRQEQLTFATGAARVPVVTPNGVFFNWLPDSETDPATADHAICVQELPPP